MKENSLFLILIRKAASSINGTGGGGYEETKEVACEKAKIHVDVYDIVEVYQNKHIANRAENSVDTGVKKSDSLKRYDSI